ncbi:MAG TPA: hypothetical protein VGO67_15500 [Verrucomicrobiae bacterium]
MKSILLCSVAVLALAGCASQSDYQSSYAGYRDLGFSFDYTPRPVHGLTASDVAPFNGVIRQGSPQAPSDPDPYKSLAK